MPKQFTEYDVADALVSATNLRSFQPTVMGFAVVNQSKNAHGPIMAAAIGIIDAFADRYGKIYNPQTEPAYRLAYHIREAVLAEYGEWPPPIDEMR